MKTALAHRWLAAAAGKAHGALGANAGEGATAAAAGDRSRQQQPWSNAEETRRWHTTTKLAIEAPTALGAAVSLKPCSDPSSDTQAQQ